MTSSIIGQYAASLQPGFRGSENSSAELIVYEQPTDPILALRNADANRRFDFDGRTNRDQEPSLVALTTNKPLQGPGNWAATIKVPEPYHRRYKFRDAISDDAWVDIVMSRHGRRYHIMRGMVDQIRKATTVSNEGAISQVYQLTGRDHQKVWEQTPIWFCRYINAKNPDENVVGSACLRVFNALNVGGPVTSIVRAYLVGFLEEIGNVGRANWVLPKSMKGVSGSDPAFINNVVFDERNFTNEPARNAINPCFMDPNGANAWAMAQEWSDPIFVEMWSDLTFGGVFGAQLGDSLSLDNSRMTVIVRDRPFPTLVKGLDSPWFSLPTVNLSPQDVKDEDLGRGGLERFNAFFVSPQILQELLLNDSVEVTAPLWDPQDMLVHGFRRFDVMSRYSLDIFVAATSEDGTLLTLTKAQRKQCRDWYAVNPGLYNGTISLGRGDLESRVGMRVRIHAPTEADQFTAYIENVSHTWTLTTGVKTSLGVTRGFYGSDREYLRMLETVANRYGGNRQGDFPASSNEGTSFA